MNFTIEREQLLKSLHQVISPLSGRTILPILGNILLKVSDNILSLTATDLEVEIVANVELTEPAKNGSITVHGRKFYDIWRGLSNVTEIKVTIEGNRLILLSKHSRFSLATIPAADFPKQNNWNSEVEFELPKITLKRLLEATQFSMANQDVRYYLNGMLFETKEKELRTVATDGHRLAISSLKINKHLPNHSVIVPRKGVIEFMRLLDNSDKLFKLQIGSNNIRAYVDNFIFTSKLIDGRFPDYRRVLPKNPDKKLTANCDKLKQAFSRASILSNEKFRSVRLYISENELKITANNPEQEESEEVVDVYYKSPTIEISFNVGYILDVLNTLKCQEVDFLLTDSNSSLQIKDAATNIASYVIMPMRI